MRVILSRKGFDTVAGRGPSPVLPDERMVPMPIPEPRPDPSSTLTYDALVVPGDQGMTYAELGERCRLRCAVGPAHLDPDLVPGTRPRRPGWRAALGQAGIAARHLHNQNIGPGDLFVFFGLYAPLTPRGLRRADRFHSLFGYLQVGDVLDANHDAPPPWLAEHPHISRAARASFRPNLVYTARPMLTFAPDQPGWGVFRFHPGLRLTPTDATTLQSWELPASFHPSAGTSVTYLPAHLWSLINGSARVEIIGNKQELVCSDSPTIEEWVVQLVSSTER